MNSRYAPLLPLVAVLAMGCSTLGFNSGPSAEEVAEAFTQACETLRTQDYDSVKTTVGSDKTSRVESRFSGGDAHRFQTWTDLMDGSVNLIEEILIDGTLYSRDSPDGDPANFGLWRVSSGKVRIEPMLCFDLYALPDAELSAAPLSSDEVLYTHFVVVYRTGLFGLARHTVAREVWIDDNTGNPRRSRRTSDTPGSSPPTILDFHYTDFGKPNVITAPVLGE